MEIFRQRQLAAIQAACGCHVGRKRKNNEDNFYFNGKFMNSENRGLSEIMTDKGSVFNGILRGDRFYAVFDGMGGWDYGEVAAHTAALAAKAFFENEENVHPYDITPSLNNLCRQMNEKVYQTGVNMGVYQMGSTVVALYLYAGHAWVCNLGDSRCYRLRRGELRQISVDHTDEAYMIAHGIVGRKPRLTQYLGINPEEMRIEPHVKCYSLEKGDRFLLCSDGLTDMVPELEICELMTRYADSKECVDRLINSALEGGGKDNITAIVCQTG